MKSNWLVLALVAALAGTLVAFGFYAKRTSADLTALKGENEQLVQSNLKGQEALAAQTQAQSDEMTRLQAENAELLRLRNEVRQLRESRQTLGQQVQAAEQQAQAAQQKAQAVTEQLQNTQTALHAQAQAQAQLARMALTQNQPQLNCINNLRQLDGAKQQWALENKKPATAMPTPADITPYLKDGMPVCPDGGSYTLHALAQVPTCSFQGHALSQ
jgi:hypothetical protein